MGVGKLDIGEGIGGATVYDVNPVIQQYGQILAQKKAKQDADNKALGDELAKGYDPSVLRNDADRQEYLKKYNDIKEQAIQAENEKNKTKKAIGLAQIRQQLSDLGSWGEKSKQQGVFERQMAMEALKNPHLLSDDASAKLKSQMSQTWDDPNTVRDAGSFERGVDPAKVDAEYLKHKAEIQKASNATFDNGTLSGVQNILGKKTGTLTQRRVVPFDGDNGAFESTLHWATAYPDVQKSLHDRYPQITDPDPNKQLALRVKQYMTDNGDGNGFVETKSKDVEGYKPQDAPRPTWIEDYNMNKYGTPNPPKDTTNEYVKTLSTGMRSGSGEQNAQQLSTIISSNPAYMHGITDVKKDAQGNITAFVVPAKYKFDAKKVDPAVPNSGRVIDKPAYPVYLNPNNPDEYDTKIANTYKDVTGDQSATVSKVEKHKGHTGQHTSNKNDPLGIL